MGPLCRFLKWKLVFQPLSARASGPGARVYVNLPNGTGTVRAGYIVHDHDRRAAWHLALDLPCQGPHWLPAHVNDLSRCKFGIWHLASNNFTFGTGSQVGPFISKSTARGPGPGRGPGFHAACHLLARPCPCQGFDSTPQRKDLFVVEEYMTKQLDRKVATRKYVIGILNQYLHFAFALYCNCNVYQCECQPVTR